MNQNAAVVGWAFAAIAFVCVVLVILLVVGIFFLLTLQKALNRCRRRNRTMEPAMVWLNLIPIFQLFWGFYTAINVGNSLKNEFVDRDLDDGSDYGKTFGIWTMALNIASGVLQNASSAAEFKAGVMLGGVMGLAWLVMFIIYWVRIAGYSRVLAEDELRGNDDDRDDDDRLRRPSRGPASTDIQSRDKDERYS